VRRVSEEISKEAWQPWLKDSVKYISTYRVALGASREQKFVLDPCAECFDFRERELHATAFASKPGALEVE
jgi:Fe-S cluster biosynthesis and repair protein YggX